MSRYDIYRLIQLVIPIVSFSFSVSVTHRIIRYRAQVPLKRVSSLWEFPFIGTECSSNLSTWNSRRLTRVCRSSAQPEAPALSNCGELTLYCQIVLKEVLTGEFQIHFLREVEACSILNPFKIAASPSDILEELKSIPVRECSLSKDSSSPAKGLTALCRDCGVQSTLAWGI